MDTQGLLSLFPEPNVHLAHRSPHRIELRALSGGRGIAQSYMFCKALASSLAQNGMGVGKINGLVGHKTGKEMCFGVGRKEWEGQ